MAVEPEPHRLKKAGTITNIDTPSVPRAAPLKPVKKIEKENLPESFLENFADDAEISPILETIKSTNTPILVTGKAGTGKSTLVKYIRDCGQFPNTVVIAPTGIAAINIAGQTIHSFFRIPPRIFSPAVLKGQRANKLWTKVDLVIIDEISMVRADLMDAMDYILRNARNSDVPFGGAKMLFVGDFHQLPPVVPKTEKEMMDKMGYKSPFAYDARVFSKIKLKKFELETVHRQSEQKFLTILSGIRNSIDPSSAIDELNRHCHRAHREDVIPLMLTGTNAAAARYNVKGLDQIDGPARTFMGKTVGKFNIAKDKLPAPERIDLKVGARVMALKNDVEKRWVNGSLGTVTAMGGESVTVKFDHTDIVGEVKLANWENIKYEWDEGKQRPVSTVVGSYSQVPLNLAWAVTIHKAQGLTLDDVRVDLAGGAFAAGQAYVALSRARTLAGLSLARPITHTDIIVERRHKEFLKPNQIKQCQIDETKQEKQASSPPQVIKNETRSKSDIVGRIPIYEVGHFDIDFINGVEAEFSHLLEISYADGKDNLTLRDLKAHFLVQSEENSQSYLVGHCGLKNERRAFRTNRIKRLYDVPKDKYITSDIQEYLETLLDH